MESPLVIKKMLETLEWARQTGALVLDCNSDGIDGRLTSIQMKRRVIEFLERKGFEVKQASNPRAWYSMLLRNPANGDMIPCNITISMGGADNFHNKNAILYTLTTLDVENIPRVMNYEYMYELAKRHLRLSRDSDKEYYMIYLHKKKPFVVVRSLCDITYFRANPSNHLQIDWTKEIKYKGKWSFVNDTPHQVFERIRGFLAESYKGIKQNMQVVTKPLTLRKIS